MKNELKKLQKLLSAEYPDCSEKLREDDEVRGGEEEEHRSSSRDAFLTITLNFLRKINQEQMADALQSSKIILRISHQFYKCIIYLLEL